MEHYVLFWPTGGGCPILENRDRPPGLPGVGFRRETTPPLLHLRSRVLFCQDFPRNLNSWAAGRKKWSIRSGIV